jgi:hypothetical protein
MEKVSEAPAKYSGQTLVFDQVKLAGKMIKHTGLYCLKVTSPEGTDFGAAVSFRPTTLHTFFVPDALADRLLDDLNEDQEYTVRLTGRVYKKKFPALGAESWVAEVSRIDFYDGDKVVRTMTATSPRSGKAPSLERVNEAPQKYAGQTLVFDHVKLGGKIIKHTGLNCLKVTGADGSPEISAAVAFTGGLTLFVPDRLEEKLEKEMKEEEEYTVKLTCRVYKRKFPAIGSEAWVGEVSRIDFYEGEAIKKVVR